MNQINQRFFREADAIFFENHYFNFWHKGIDKRWFWLAFQALEKAGLTYYETEKEEVVVRERLVILAILYYEYCYRSAAHESENFNFWDQDLVFTIKRDFSNNVSENIIGVRNALVNYFKSEKGVTDELWLSCFEGQNNLIVPFAKKWELLSESEDDYNKTKAEEWFNGCIDGIDEYYGISI
jgi:hypothetical protein